MMLAKGYGDTSIDEICNAAGVTKGGLFHHFASKEELAKAALRQFYLMTGGQVLGAPFPDDIDPLDRVLGRIDIVIAMARAPNRPGSCLIGNLTQEVSHTHPELRAVCDELFSMWVTGFQRELDEAKAKHAPRAAWSTKSLAEHLLATIQGSLLLAKSSQDRSIVEKNLLHYRQYLENLFGIKKGGQGRTNTRTRLTDAVKVRKPYRAHHKGGDL
ncbi:MAG: TetR/AcrR family transcriptional regulator [Chloroflexi bacterium]|nr:TetR/AcrR family transcriptional regulator [Chloroflexota bacterium]